jgi:hypothetical protein
MDGDLRYAVIREQIATQHEIARVERSARFARVRQEARSRQSTWSTGVAAVVGTTRRRLSRKPATA